MKLDRANSGREPPANILRAIRHGVAAGACDIVAKETGKAEWRRAAEIQRALAREVLGQAADLDSSATEDLKVWIVARRG